MGGWVCEFEQFPGVILTSSSDQSGDIPGLVCKRVDGALPGSSLNQSYTFWKILRLVEGLPF